MFKDYKISRDKPPETKAEKALAEQRLAYRRQLPYLKLAIRTLGVRQIGAINYEADDLAALMIERSPDKSVMLISGDKDWIQLIGPKISWLDPIRNERLTLGTLPERLGWHPIKKKISICDGKSYEGFIGVPNPQAWLEMKALMGDISDDIPGVGKIGPKGAIELLTTYGSVTNFMNSYIDGTLDMGALPKKLADFAVEAEKRDNFQRNMMLMDLHTKHRPVAINLKVNHSAFSAGGFRTICNRFFFKSILDRFDQWIEPFSQPMKAAA